MSSDWQMNFFLPPLFRRRLTLDLSQSCDLYFPQCSFNAALFSSQD